MAIIHKIQELDGFAYSFEKDRQFELTESMIDNVEKTLGLYLRREYLILLISMVLAIS